MTFTEFDKINTKNESAGLPIIHLNYMSFDENACVCDIAGSLKRMSISELVESVVNHKAAIKNVQLLRFGKNGNLFV